MKYPQLTLKVEPSAPPQAPTKLDDEVKEKLKLVLSSRFNLQTKALNLSKFHADPAFLGESVYLPLNRYNVMIEVRYCVSNRLNIFGFVAELLGYTPFPIPLSQEVSSCFLI